MAVRNCNWMHNKSDLKCPGQCVSSSLRWFIGAQVCSHQPPWLDGSRRIRSGRRSGGQAGRQSVSSTSHPIPWLP
jgi:hypothetical protein